MGAGETVIISSYPPTEHDLQQKTPRLPRRVVNDTRFWASRFFPWSADKAEVKIQDITKARYVPWLGIGALVLSGMTILFSWIVLKVIDGHMQKDGRYLKPASWLSVILSANSVLLGFAISEGITIAWWYTVSRTNATIRDIHEAWSLGSSIFAAIRAGKRFNYVALATIFVASIPLNGVLLQNAITTVPGTHVNTTMITIGMATELPRGFSASLSGGSVSTYSDTFSQALTWIDLDVGVIGADNMWFNTPIQSGSGSCGADDLLGTCTGRAHTYGFGADCTDSSEPYDIDPKSHNGQPFPATIFSSKVGWDVNTPGEFNLTLRLKNTTDCVGHYAVRNCIFRAAQLSYPIQLIPLSKTGPKSNLRGYGEEFPTNVLGLDPNTSFYDDQVLSYLTVPSEANSTNSTFGGVVDYLQTVYDAELIWDWDGTRWHVNATGKPAENAVITSFFLNENYYTDDNRTESEFPTSSLEDPDYCKNTLFLYQIDGRIMLEDQIKDRLRNTMFLSGVMVNSFALVDWFTQNVTVNRTADVAIYKIIYGYWAGSLAVTVTVIFMVIPTFWGFWLLSGKLTMSPIDTATVLEAPLVRSENCINDSKARLKEIGSRPLHPMRRDGSSNL
ncbi:hypothetical protein PV04_00393 [Phialophora macrospora]|uniref:Uncharacterized protein n=1 Tax=Phialophora macrospora TaxID=1851006 RepID=A0A0D2D3Q7_9EURO|nr:hypothetical protein PV04_00393 [Phialophora macrospora]